MWCDASVAIALNSTYFAHYTTGPDMNCELSRKMSLKQEKKKVRSALHNTKCRDMARYDLARHGPSTLKMLFWRPPDENKLDRTWRPSRRILRLEVGQEVAIEAGPLGRWAHHGVPHVTRVSRVGKVPDVANKGAEGASFVIQHAVGFRYFG